MVFGVLVGIAVLVVLAVVPVHYYNRGITLRNRCRESFANVEAELQRRYELIPNLVAAVKRFMQHERALLTDVTRLRAAALADHGGPAHQAATERPLVAALDRLLAVAEANPRLRASENFLRLQQELAFTEDRIQAARRFYNGNVRDYRDHTRHFPGNLFARLYGFPPASFFEVDPVARAAPQVVVA